MSSLGLSWKRFLCPGTESPNPTEQSGEGIRSRLENSAGLGQIILTVKMIQVPWPGVASAQRPPGRWECGDGGDGAVRAPLSLRDGCSGSAAPGLQGFLGWLSGRYGQLSGMVEPLAGIFGAFAVVLAEPLLPYALGFAAGAMVYVVMDDIIPEAQTRWDAGNGPSPARLGRERRFPLPKRSPLPSLPAAATGSWRPGPPSWDLW